MNDLEKKQIKENVEEHLKKISEQMPYISKFYDVSIIENGNNQKSIGNKIFSNKFYKHISKIIDFNEEL